MNETEALYDPFAELLAILSEEDLIRLRRRAKVRGLSRLVDFLSGELGAKEMTNERR
jgi:hypothetical protein